jgi:hypothetical protein
MAINLEIKQLWKLVVVSNMAMTSDGYKYQQTWGWNLMNINRVGIWIWIWHITLLCNCGHTLDRRIIKPNSFWTLAYTYILFASDIFWKKYEIFPSHRSYIYLPTYYSSTVLFIFEYEKIIHLSRSNMQKREQYERMLQHILKLPCLQCFWLLFYQLQKTEKREF